MLVTSVFVWTSMFGYSPCAWKSRSSAPKVRRVSAVSGDAATTTTTTTNNNNTDTTITTADSTTAVSQ